MRSKKVSREDVARVAGTSTAVISYVLNNGPRPVAAKTRERVLSAIEATGYRPNRIARALAAGSSGNIGLVVPDISNPFFAELAYQLENYAFEAGKILILADTADDSIREATIVDNLLQTQVDGLVFVGVDNSLPLQQIIDSETPLVVMDRDVGPAATNVILIDNFAAATKATEHLIHHGFQRIDCITGPSTTSTGRFREDGWKHALREAALPIDDSRVIQVPFTKQGGADAARTLLEDKTNRPNAIFVASEQQAIGVMYVAWQLGLHIPNDLAIVSFDGTEASKYATPPLTTVVQPIAEIARTAIELLLAPSGDPKEWSIGFNLVVRASCGCNPQHAE